MPLVISTLQKSNFDFLDIESFNFDHTPPHTPLPTHHQNGQNGTSGSYGFPSPLHINSNKLRSAQCDSATSSPSRMNASADDFQNGKFLARKLIPQHTLRLAGLDRGYVDEWVMSIIKVIFYEDLTPNKKAVRNRSPTSGRFFNYTATEEGISLVADETVLAEFPEHYLNMSVSLKPLKCIQVDLTDYGLDRYGIVYSMADPLATNEINLLYLSTYMTANILVRGRICTVSHWFSSPNVITMRLGGRERLTTSNKHIRRCSAAGRGDWLTAMLKREPSDRRASSIGDYCSRSRCLCIWIRNAYAVQASDTPIKFEARCILRTAGKGLRHDSPGSMRHFGPLFYPPTACFGAIHRELYSMIVDSFTVSGVCRKFVGSNLSYGSRPRFLDRMSLLYRIALCIFCQRKTQNPRRYETY